MNVNRKAEIDYEKCIGCGQCVALCQYDAAVMGGEDTSERLNYKIAEYSLAVVKGKPHFHGNRLSDKHEQDDLCGCDKFHLMHPDTDWLAGLKHAEKIGLGTMDYELIRV